MTLKKIAMFSILWRSLFILTISFQITFCKRFYDNNQQYHQELLTIQKGKPFVQNLLQNQTIVRKELLCATFLKGGNSLAHRMLFVNMRKLGKTCDFAVILYGGEPKQVPVCNQTNPSLGKIIHCDLASIAKKRVAPKGVYPKPNLYMDLRPYLPYYRRVFLIDEDISLFKFNYTIYSAIWNCGFYPSPPPLITQALVSEGTQWFKYVHFDRWKVGRKSLLWAVESVFVEQQAPLLDSTFFHWFLEFVLPPVLEMSFQTGSDWGVDIIWCYAAYMYARQILDIKDPHYVPCALLVKAPPIVHRNGQTISLKSEKWQEFNEAGHEVVDYYRRLYPTWIAKHTDPWFNPLNDKNTHFIRRKKLNQTCYPHPLRML